MTAVVLAAQDVRKTYGAGETQVEALRGIDLSVAQGEMVAIMGPSGSGKSTLLCILGAVESPSTGKVLLEGKDLSRLGDDERTLMRRRRIGFVFQAFNLLPTLTALENVALPLELDGISGRAAREKARSCLELVGMTPRQHHLPRMLSGGEQQRVAIARALAIEPALVLADEPTGNLDSASGQRVINILRQLVSERGQTVVLVTHDDNIAASADRTIRLRDGKIDTAHSKDVVGRPFFPAHGAPVQGSGNVNNTSGGTLNGKGPSQRSYAAREPS
jgi:putative ABC transport system ATP-binding protein